MEQGGTMAAGPGVSMQSCSPARELSVSVQQGGNQTHGDRVKTEEVTGKNATRALFFLDNLFWDLGYQWLTAKSAHYVGEYCCFLCMFYRFEIHLWVPYTHNNSRLISAAYLYKDWYYFLVRLKSR